MGSATKQTLLKGLTQVFLSVSFAFGVAGCSPKVEKPGNHTVETAPAEIPNSVRDLTPGEKALLQSLFGTEIDLSSVRLKFCEAEKSEVSSVVHVNGVTSDITFYGKKNMSDDFSRDKNAFNFGSFVYQMTCILQSQQGKKWKHAPVAEKTYVLDSHKSFGDYGWEQQKSIMEDYARRFLHPDRKSLTLPDMYGLDRADTDAALQSLVETRFPGAKEARIAFSQIKTRALMQDEAALIAGIFGRQINTDIMRNLFHPEKTGKAVLGEVAASVNSMEDIDFWGPRYFSADFAREADSDLFGTFVHECVHIWQRQTEQRHTPNRKEGEYLYKIDTKSRFTDYSIEQQAAMVEDYARMFLHSAKKMNWLPKAYGPKERVSKMLLLRKIVEDQFPDAKPLREAYMANHPVKKPVSIAMVR